MSQEGQGGVGTVPGTVRYRDLLLWYNFTVYMQ
jgi:hypothetical protein